MENNNNDELYYNHLKMFNALGKVCLNYQTIRGCKYNTNDCKDCYIEQACRDNRNEFRMMNND